jgi:sulfur relay (sulfurtransferase) DsrF/TusC family protein
MDSVLIIVDKAPYGYEDTFSGFYVAIACLNRGMASDVLLVGDGIYAAIKDQNPGGSVNYPNVGELSYLVFPEGNIFVHLESMQERGIEEEDLVEAAQIVNDTELYDIIKSKTKETAFIRI